MSTIDKKDKQIIEVLREHGEYTTRQIAKKTQLPVTTIHHRLQKLRKTGIIRKYTILVDDVVLDRGLLVYVLVSINLKYLKSRKKSQSDIAYDLRKFSFIERVDIVSGSADLILMVRVKDIAEFNRVLSTKIQLVDGVEHTQSLFVMHSIS